MTATATIPAAPSAERRVARQTRILDALRAGATRRSACRLASAGVTQFYAWLAADAGFARRVAEAEEAAIQAAMHPAEWVELLGTALREGARADDLRAIARAIPADQRARVLEALADA